MEVENKVMLKKQEEQIKTLFKRMEDMESIKNLVHSLDKNAAVQTQLLESIVEYNRKQEITNKQMTDNYGALANQYEKLDTKVDVIECTTETLSTKVADNETMHTLDTRTIQKEGLIENLKNGLWTGGILLAIVKIIIEIIKSTE